MKLDAAYLVAIAALVVAVVALRKAQAVEARTWPAIVRSGERST